MCVASVWWSFISLRGSYFGPRGGSISLRGPCVGPRGLCVDLRSPCAGLRMLENAFGLERLSGDLRESCVDTEMIFRRL